MKVRLDISRTNPVRAMARRAWRAANFRADVHVDQLARRLAVLETLSDASTHIARIQPRILATMSPSWHPDLLLERIGSEFDGGYVLPMRIVESTTGVVSVGVGDNNDADFELAQRGIPVQAWDHTVDDVPRVHDLITFHPVGVGPESSVGIETLGELTEASFGPEAADLVLLMDVEGSEWSVLSTCSDRTLDRFSVISVEFHGIADAIIPGSEILDVLERLRERFTPVAVHANNHSAVWRSGGFVLPDILEVTYVRCGLVPESPNSRNCPNNLLAPCCPDLPEIHLDWSSSEDKDDNN